MNFKMKIKNHFPWPLTDEWKNNQMWFQGSRED